ncbi:MAG: O-antigen ligase family protein [Ignavibacteriaceae bacterium]
MFNGLLNIEKRIFITSLILGAVTLLILPYMWIGIMILLALIAFMMLGDKYLIPLFIIAYLVVTSDISENLRVVVNIGGFIILSYKFIKEYGLDFSIYKQVPIIVRHLIVYIILSMIVSSIFSEQIFTSLLEVLRLSAFFYLMYIFYSFLRDSNDVIIYLDSLVKAGIILSLAIIFFFLSSSEKMLTLEAQGLIHEGGYLKNVAAAGGIFAVTIPFNLAAFYLDRFTGGKIKIVLTGALILQTVAMLLTNSRAAFLALFISSVFILLKLHIALLKKIIYSIVGLSFLIVSFFPKIIEIISDFIRAGRILENTRYYLWDIAFGIIKDNPIFGCGHGMFKYYIYKYLPVMLGSWDESQINRVYREAGAGHAHNFLLYRTSEGGLLGLIGAVALIALFFYLSQKVLNSVKYDRDWTIIVTTIIASGLGLVARSLFESTGLLTNGWITRDLPFWILFIIVIFLYQNIVILKKKYDELLPMSIRIPK